MTHAQSMTERRFVVGVRELAEFTARRGDLDLRFSLSPTAQEGLAGHARVAGRRSTGYEREVMLSANEPLLTVRGRADGYDASLQRLEEVKTYRGRFESIRADQRTVHWAQAQIYGHLMCQARGLTHIELALVYLNLDDEQETVLQRSAEATELAQFFREQCDLFLSWAQQELQHQSERAQLLQQLSFPLPAMRPGQRELAEATWRTMRAGHCLMAQAPTGIGKTLGALFPSLKALGMPRTQDQAMDKLFYLSAKSSGRHLALSALGPLLKPQDAKSAQGSSLRVLELMAREKACEHPDKACHGSSCPLAQGFYDKLPRARSAAVRAAWLDASSLRALALQHQLCPYHLSRDLIAWADVVVGDYNHWFDPHAALYALSVAQGWRVGVLVDEAHNLVERGRQMYSIELSEVALRRVRKLAPPALAKSIDRLRRQWRKLRQGAQPYQVLDELPRPLLLAMQSLSSSIVSWQAEHPETAIGPLQQLGFDLGQFLLRASQTGAHRLVDMSLEQHGTPEETSRLCVRNIVPGDFLAPRWQSAHASVLFSATLAPSEHYRQLLGLPQSALTLELSSPFNAEHLQVRVLDQVSTRWADRTRSLPALVDVMAWQWSSQPGKYLAFFSSFDYLRQASAALLERYPEVPQWQQESGMDEDRQRAFVERFRSGGPGIGFAVLGGSFAEGIDLPGEQLVGAFVATLGLPPLNRVHEEMRRRLQALMGQGYEHVYLYPGLRKVIQAAGRVIRTPTDRGVLWLLDERYAQAQVRQLLPPGWQVQLIAGRDDPAMAATRPADPAPTPVH